MASKRIQLRWTGEGLVFKGGGDAGGEIVIDGDTVAGPSPMDVLLLGLAGCMGSDVRDILKKSRVPVDELEIIVDGERAATVPRKYVRIHMVIRVKGPGAEHDAKVRRSVDLSRETYCSVLHSLRPDIEFEFEIQRL